MSRLLFWRALYRLVLLILRPGVRLRLRLRRRTEPAYGERVGERFGRLPEEMPRSPVWFHTVSAGETIAAAPLIASLTDEFPDVAFLVTTMTPTGSAQVRKLLGGRVSHCYAPYDFPRAVAAFFDRVQPRLLVLMETELWPNMLRQADTQGVPSLLVNARLSERSAKGYARIGPLTREMLRTLKFLACQYPAHEDRFLALGAVPERTGCFGSVKFDVVLPDDHRDQVAARQAAWQIGERPVWIAGSTHPGEEAVLLAAHAGVRERFPDALLILVPRHPSRSDEVASLIEAAGLEHGRTSTGESLAGTDVVLADSMGELLYLYGLSRVAFLGGSLVPVGGHNPIEAAVCGVPLLMGPETFNFADVVSAFQAAGCLTLVDNEAALRHAVVGCFADPDRTRRAGGRAAEVVAQNRGATERLLTMLRAEIGAVVGGTAAPEGG